MNTNTAAQAHHQLGSEPGESRTESTALWSTTDDLLVWTVSRLDGGRRRGVERDCHVVYGLSREYFVEQTRQFRASAEQCIEMLQQGKRAGTTQRKIELDSIVAVRSDARSGRLQIRTLNGTHQLDPVSYTEADVLRQIAIELEVRMPPGGAEFAPVGFDSGGQGTRFETTADERRALASLNNARAEDVPDGYREPQYHHDAFNPDDEPIENDSAVSDGHLTEEELEHLGATLAVEIDPDEVELPADITVVGGVDITFDPTPVSYGTPPDSPESLVQADPLSEDPSSEIAASSVEAAAWATAQETVADTPIYMSEQAEEGMSDSVPQFEGVIDAPDAEIDQPIYARFGRLQHRALRRQIETGSALPADAQEPTTASPSADIAAPADDQSVVAEASTPMPATEPTTSSDERRQTDDPNFPSIFDRRRSGPSDHARFGDDLPISHSADHDASPTVDYDGESGQSAMPPESSAPEGPAPDGMDGTVGFNPDFDVNPFR